MIEFVIFCIGCLLGWIAGYRIGYDSGWVDYRRRQNFLRRGHHDTD